MVGPKDNGCRPASGTQARVALLYELEERCDSLLNLIPAVDVNFQIPADRVADILFEDLQRLIEFPQEEGFLSRLRVEHHDRVDVAVGHAKDIIRLIDQLRGDHLAALGSDIDPKLPDRLHRIDTGGLTIHGAQAG